jgi:phosphate starvation-inducible PhoH-like protein
VVPPGRMLEVFGDRDAVLRRVEELVACEVIVRGNEILLRGDEAAVGRAEAVFDGLVELSESGNHPNPETAERLYRMGVEGDGKEVLGDVILTHRGRRVRSSASRSRSRALRASAPRPRSTTPRPSCTCWSDRTAG